MKPCVGSGVTFRGCIRHRRGPELTDEAVCWFGPVRSEDRRGGLGPGDFPWPPDGGGRTVLSAGRTANGWIAYFQLNGHYVIEAKGITVSDLLTKSLLRKELGGDSIIDMTGLKGLYDVSLRVPGVVGRMLSMAESSLNAAGASDPAGADLFTSFEKLGLKLENRKVPIKHLVVDHAEKVPSAN
jgi:uncharacterized protein (TIGR03435 family)